MLPASRVSVSAKKLQGSGLPEPTVPADRRATGYRLIELGNLQAYLLDVLKATCRHCHSNRLVICENEDKRRGLMSVLRLRCLGCAKNGKEFETSPKRIMDTPGQSLDVNRRAAFASLVMGKSRSGIEQFCAVMGMPPPPNESSWRRHLKHIGESVQKTASATMQRAVEQIRAILGEQRGSQLGEGELLNEAVSFDGTWAKRGFSSLFGVQAVIHMETGKLLDNQVHSKICNVCRVKEAELKDKNSDDLVAWRKTHQPACDKNTDVSSNAMEAQGAKEMWTRSVERNRMQYTTFVGDGDSKAYKTVCEEKPYGEVEIKKADCIGHVQKRMGSRLRE